MFLTLLVCTTRCCLSPFFFFFNDTATTEIYTLSLHDALPISRAQVGARLDEHLDRFQGARAHGVMKGGGVRVEIRAGAVQLDSEIDHPPQGVGPAAVRRQDKPELPVPGARCTRKTSNIVPTPEQ